MVKRDIFQFERSNGELDEVIGVIPSWIVRWGISFLLFLLVSILCILKFVKYPDTVSCAAELLAKEKPYQVAWNPLSSEIAYNVNVQEGSRVNKNDTLLVGEHSVDKRRLFVLAPFPGRVHVIKKNTIDSMENRVILVSDKDDYDVIINIPSDKFSQVKVNQRVLINVSEFPESEYGYLEGCIIGIVPIKVDGYYPAYASLTKGLSTSKSFSIPKQPAFSGRAEIITKDISLFDNVFHF